jgi:outer membrane protein TolC
LAAETVAIPAVRLFSQLGEAIYAPLAASQQVAVRSSNSVAVENTMLLEVATRYIDLAAAEARLEAIRASQAEVAFVEQTAGAFAKTGQGREGDYRRAQTEALLMKAEEQDAQQAVGTASAELVRLLHLDPCIRLTTLKAPIELVQLVDPNYDVEQLVQIGLMRRPEIAARSSAIAEADMLLQQECVRPFLPLVSVGFSAGGFGGGSNRTDLNVASFYQRTGSRSDFDVFAVWSLQNLGFGNRAMQNRRRAERDQSITERVFVATQVRREVTQAYAVARAQKSAVLVTERQLQVAARGMQEEFRRVRAGQARPIESLDTVTRLSRARQNAIAAVVAYNIAQFRLFVAIGETPTEANPDPVDATRAAPAGVAVPNPK